MHRRTINGKFSVRVPPDGTYVLEVEAYGQKAGEVEVEVGETTWTRARWRCRRSGR
jgi:hypothetical protein